MALSVGSVQEEIEREVRQDVRGLSLHNPAAVPGTPPRPARVAGGAAGDGEDVHERLLGDAAGDGGGGGEVPVQHVRLGGIPDSVANLTNSIIGGGILTIPFAIAASGWLLAVVLAVLFAALVSLSIHLLVLSSDATGKSSYESLAMHLYGPRVVMGTRISKGLLTFGACTGYFIAIGETLEPVVAEWFGEDSAMNDYRVIVLTVGLVPVLSLALLRTLHAVRWASWVALASVVFLNVVVVIKYAEGNDRPAEDEPVEAVVLGTSTLSAFGLWFFSFGCHLSAIILYGELRAPTPARMQAITVSTLAVAFMLYMTLGIFGYLSFGGDTQGNVFTNYGDDDGLILVARCILVLSLICTYPHVSYVVRQVINDLVWPNEPYMPRARLVLLSTCVVASSMALAIGYPKIAVVFSISGSTCGVANYYLWPTLFYLRVLDSEAKSGADVRWRRLGTYALMAFGLGTGAVSLVVTVLEEIGAI